MGHSLRPDNLTITPDFVISDGTHNTGYVLVSATGGVASWKNISNLPGFTTKHYVGELWGGGVVADVWKENDVEKCLIVALSDYSYVDSIYEPIDDVTIYFSRTQFQWSSTTATGSATSSHNGLANTNSTLIQLGGLNARSALYCTEYTNPDYSTGTFSDWYLPSLSEMSQVVNNSFKINSAINKYAIGNSKTILTWDSFDSLYVNYISKYQQNDSNTFPTNASVNIYWTSTEVMNSGGLLAYAINASDNTISKINKTTYDAVRPVRIASETTIITKHSLAFSPSVPINSYTITLVCQINGAGDLITEIGVCWSGPYANSTSSIPGIYGTGPDKVSIPLATTLDNKITSTLIYNSSIGVGYGTFSANLSGTIFNKTLGNYSIRAYAITNNGIIKYGQQLVL